MLATIFYEAVRDSSNNGDYNLYLLLAGFGFTALLFGLGIAVNGWYFTLPRQDVIDHSKERVAQQAVEQSLDTAPQRLPPATLASTVTEHTTRELAGSGKQV